MLTILIGVPGSGKTTKARTMMGECCEADQYPYLYRDGRLQGGLLTIAHQDCQHRVESLMRQGMPVIQSNTNLNLNHIMPYFQLAQQYNYGVQLVLPSHDLFHYQHTLSREEQKDLLYSIRSSPESEHLIPPSVMMGMILSFDQIKARIANRLHVTNPTEWIQWIQRL